MNIETKNEILPKLRFPEFKNLHGWQEETLGILCDYWNGASHEGGVVENGDYYLISLNSIDIDGKLKSEMKRLSYTDNSLQKNDLIMVLSDVAHGNFLGLTDIIPNNQFVLNQRMAGLRIKDPKAVNAFFLRTFINYNQKYFKEKGQGSSQLNLSKLSVTEFPVLLPKPKEQNKIADFLSSIEEFIIAQSQKLEALKAHKKGLMQQLFPAEGETVPKLRFEEFWDGGEWEEKTLGSICSNISSGKDRIVENGEYNLYGSTGVIGKTNSSYDGNFILVARVGANAGLLTRANEKFGVTDNTLVLFLYNSECLDFVYYTLERFGLNKLVFGSGQPLITGGQLKSLIIYLPKPKEQQIIADCLSSLDELITVQTEKIEVLQMHKKGLMQGLFPAILNK